MELAHRAALHISSWAGSSFLSSIESQPEQEIQIGVASGNCLNHFVEEREAIPVPAYKGFSPRSLLPYPSVHMWLPSGVSRVPDNLASCRVHDVLDVKAEFLLQLLHRR
jgi:hypothetical protein